MVTNELEKCFDISTSLEEKIKSILDNYHGTDFDAVFQAHHTNKDRIEKLLKETRRGLIMIDVRIFL